MKEMKTWQKRQKKKKKKKERKRKKKKNNNKRYSVYVDSTPHTPLRTIRNVYNSKLRTLKERKLGTMLSSRI